MIKGLFAVVGGIFIVVVVKAAVDGPSSDQTAPAASAAPAPTPVPAAPPIEVDARKLWKAYSDNEVSADTAYKGKRLKVTGVIASIDKNAWGSIYLSLKTQSEFESVHANMKDSEAKTVSTLRKGTKVEVICTGGTRIIGSPMLDNCAMESIWK